VANHGPVKKYITPLLSNELPVLEEHPVPLHERMEEEMFLGLRKTQGVSLEIFKNKFFVEMTEIFRKPLEEGSAKDLLKVEGGFVRLTERGKLLGNEVFQTFLGVIDSD
jgi:oxygen-independent coproporphyrinogen-3 oxidase